MPHEDSSKITIAVSVVNHYVSSSDSRVHYRKLRTYSSCFLRFFSVQQPHPPSFKVPKGLKNKSDVPPMVEADLASHVNLSNGVAQFSNLSFHVPGAVAQMKGAFNVLNEKVDFYGALKTDAELSNTTHGIKAALLKPLDPLFKRKHHEAVIPVEMTGTYPHPHFGMEAIPKH